MAPGAPTPKEQDRDHITIQWEPPSNDGGAPITGYEVERKEPKTNRWIKVIFLQIWELIFFIPYKGDMCSYI